MKVSALVPQSLVARVGLGVLLTIVVVAVLAPIVAPYAPDALDLANRRGAPSTAHPFGTDELGRDLLTRVLYGARVSLVIGFLAAALSVAIGVVIGTIAGYARGVVDDLLMRLTDAALFLPRLPLLMIAAAFLTPGIAGLALLVALVGWMESARVVRAAVMSLSTRDFVTAARATGTAPARVVWRHILPGVAPVAAVATVLAVARSILLESTLSFFGVGVQPPAASWGAMLYQAQTTMTSEPWIAIAPGAMIFLTVLCLNLAAENADNDAGAVEPSQ